MKISKIQHHGKTRYRVNNPHGSNGKRERKFFETREAAESYVSERTKDTKAYGVHVRPLIVPAPHIILKSTYRKAGRSSGR